MPVSKEINSALQRTRDDDLSSIEITDSPFQKILSYRLLVERLGEEDLNRWWDSLVMSEFGRNSLEEVTPRTNVEARIDLAQRIGREAERERLSADTISMFYLGSSFENRLERSLSGLNASTDFERLEGLDVELTSTGWTSETTAEGEFSECHSGNTVELGTISRSKLDSTEAIDSAAQRLFTAYSASTVDQLRVPYFSVEQ